MLRGGRELLRSPSHRQFLRSAYRAVLNREPDPDGGRYYLDALRRGRLTREDVLRSISCSSEAARLALKSPGMREHLAAFAATRHRLDPDLRPLCFLHVMKTGGTALNTGLRAMTETWPRLLDIWPDQMLCFPRPILGRALLVSGHLPYGMQRLLGPDAAACTVIRDPLDRTLSHYVHERTHGRRFDLTLEEFVQSDEWRRRWVDFQARWLATDVPVEDIWSGRFPGAERGAPPERFVNAIQDLQDASIALDSDDVAEVALARLDTIELVGVTEHLDWVLEDVAAFWDVPPPPPLERANERLVAFDDAQLTDDLRTEILAGTRADAALHARSEARATAARAGREPAAR